MPKRTYKITPPISSLKPDPEGSGIFDAPQMQIYDEIIMATMQGLDPSETIQRLVAVPVEERYTSRIIAALGFAFGDFDSACVRIDLDTLPAAEVERMEALIEMRSAQFCILLREFVGSKLMKTIISEAIERAAVTPEDNPSERDLAA
jgi:hypothetical protein